MIGIHSVEQVREVEREFTEANPDVELMQLAAERITSHAMEMAPDGVILVAVGPGNNGGDGLYAARNLARAGRTVFCWLISGEGHAGGIVAARQAGIRFADSLAVLRFMPDVSLVIDAMLGIGARAELPHGLAWFPEACRTLAIPVLAVDLPSGLAADDHHRPSVAMQATRTITFGAPKLCHLAQPAASMCGELVIARIGLEFPDSDINQMQRVDVARWWPWPTPYADKYSRGVLGIDTGSERYPGAAVLSVTGAIYSGAGMIRFSGPQRSSDLVLNRLPSVTMGAGHVQAWLAGCGWGREATAERLVPIIESGLPALIDAEALRVLPEEIPEGWLLTPHAGELADLLGISRQDVVNDPIGRVREASERLNSTVMLKGATQYVAEPSGQITLAIPGPAWTAQAGSGDVLAGICGTLLAAGLPPWKAGAIGASLQALAAGVKAGPYPPEVVAEGIPQVLDELAGIGSQASLAGDLRPSSIAVE